jgi:hypothetical protein
MEDATLRFQALVKWLLSFTKAEWQVNDYPLRFREQLPTAETPAPPRWSVQVVNWWQMGGLGATREDALANLASNMKSRRDGKGLPRPGSIVPIEFAPTERIGAHAELFDDFAQRILEWESGAYFVSDGSSLFDVADEAGIERLHKKIATVYGVDVSDIVDGTFWKIMDRIAAGRS